MQINFMFCICQTKISLHSVDTTTYGHKCICWNLKMCFVLLHLHFNCECISALICHYL